MAKASFLNEATAKEGRMLVNPVNSACGGDHRIHKPAATIFVWRINVKNRAWGGVHFSALNALITVYF